MALAGILRRSACTVVPQAARVVAGQRLRHTAAVTSLIRHGNLSHQRNARPAPATGFPIRRHYSASSDEKLLEVIESEIQCAAESNEQEEAVEAPDGFAFKIEDNPGQNFITLERQYNGEIITVEVSMPDLVNVELNDNDDDDEEKSSYSNIPLIVKVAKNNRALLEFACTAFPDEITIDALSMKSPEISEEELVYEGPEFSDLDENLQKAFRKYLEVRGIKPSMTDFLHEYMTSKDNKEYLRWLNEVKKFIEP